MQKKWLAHYVVDYTHIWWGRAFKMEPVQDLRTKHSLGIAKWYSKMIQEKYGRDIGKSVQNLATDPSKLWQHPRFILSNLISLVLYLYQILLLWFN